MAASLEERLISVWRRANGRRGQNPVIMEGWLATI